MVRGGILSVDAGQMEAAQSLGIGRRHALHRIVIPQAMRSIVPTADHAPRPVGQGDRIRGPPGGRRQPVTSPRVAFPTFPIDLLGKR
ncbi:hypothetical protein GCM10010448_10830 [Streptomyces glomeratus]|uniref:ABC transmembrane type-1 domain-containing protein n=1 Tax=Streptomyces glomeratus TaxID=284452 RepID=A0ABP6L7R3_9ACTN